ncbi:sterol desaturase family protein [Hyphomonas sp.]|uniref:sterol desaturase family protein n=1 Tax=Hyphomonas sp. TaxID=87 RepID=UPI000C465375|nr:sterol desaturase family protein [Hyphomonas sp.]MAU67393.1 hypothetical protein [Hyphomonas sp.]
MPDHTFTLADALWVYLATLIIFLLEAVTGRLRTYTRRDFGLTMLTFLTNSATTRPLMALAVGYVATWLVPQGAGFAASVPVWQSALIVFFTVEFAFYWIHRWGHVGQKKGHKLAWLWKIHRTHHSATTMNSSIVQRQNIFWAVFTPHIWMIALFIYAGMEPGVAIYMVVFYLWNTFTHMHWRTDAGLLTNPAFRALSHIFIMPTMHHAHHGYGKNGKMYCNYGLCLSVFDWMFGTLFLPDDQPSRYGVPGEQAHWAEEAFYPLNLFGKRREKQSASSQPAYSAATEGNLP